MYSAKGYLLAPATRGDPYTCVTFWKSPLCIVTGTAGGLVHLWTLPQLFEEAKEDYQQVLIAKDAFSEKGREQEAKYACRMLSQESEEGIRALHVSTDGTLYALVGDLFCKTWKDGDAETLEYFKFKRINQSLPYCMTYCIYCNPNIAMIPSGGSYLHFVDLNSLEQWIVDFKVPQYSIPTYYDHDRLILVQYRQEDSPEVQIWKGFSQNSELPQCTAVIKFPTSKSSYWGFQMGPSASKLVIVSLQCKFSIWDLTSSPCTKIKSFNAHSGTIVSFLVEEEKETGEMVIISIGSEKVLKIWKDCKLIRQIRNISGEFQLNYPYFIKRFGDWLLYSADQGIYCIPMPR